MSNNSPNIKGLQHGISREAKCFQSQIVNSKIPKRERDLAYIKARLRCLQVFLGLFLMFSTNKSFAQTGNSCSNPYEMNLTNGAGNAEFQFHYPDTLMYVKIANLSDKQIFGIQIDSVAILDFKKISIFNNNCQGNYIYDVDINTDGKKNINFKIDFNSNIDTILLVYHKSNYNSNCSGCDTLNLKFNVLVNQIQGGAQPCNANYPNYCKIYY